MRFDASQQMRLGQHMKLAPRMIQSMEILQMPLLQLEERIAQELESNVTLEVDEGEGAAATATAESPEVAEPGADAELEGEKTAEEIAEAGEAADADEEAGGAPLDGEPVGADERPLTVD